VTAKPLLFQPMRLANTANYLKIMRVTGCLHLFVPLTILHLCQVRGDLS